MQRLFKCVALLALWMAFAATAAIEQYTLYLDTDGVTTGQCTAGSLSGADAKIDVSVDNSANAITAVTLATCSGTSYDTASALNTGDWSLSIGTGIDGSDVIQGRIPLAQLGNPTTVSILASSSAGGNSDMAGSEWVGVSIDTTTDTGDGNTQAVPALSTVAVGALLCLFLIVSIVAYRRRFGHYHWVLVMVCLPLVLSIAWALTWTTVINDAQETGNSGDIIQVRLANDSDYLYVQLSTYIGESADATPHRIVDVEVNETQMDQTITDYLVVSKSDVVKQSKSGSGVSERVTSLETNKNQAELLAVTNTDGDVAYLLAMKVTDDAEPEISIETSAEVFVLMSSEFYGLEIADYSTLLSRIRAHSRFSDLVTELTQQITKGSPCPMSIACSINAATIGDDIAKDIDLTGVSK